LPSRIVVVVGPTLSVLPTKPSPQMTVWLDSMPSRLPTSIVAVDSKPSELPKLMTRAGTIFHCA